MNDSAWPFSDPKNVAVFTVSDIMHRRLPILRVRHDEVDGAWQFLTGGPLPHQKEWMRVALEEIVKVDPTVLGLAALPYGYQATRTAPGGEWVSERQKIPRFSRDILRHEFYAEEGSFLIQARCRLNWDWDAFRRLTSAMYDVAEEVKGQPSIETWVAEGFWYCDTFIRDWTSHPNFPRPPEVAYQDALELVHNLASFLFTGLNPYKDDTLRKKARGLQQTPE
jgi:hypothetical protein